VNEDATDVEAWYYLADLGFHQGTNIGTPAAESQPAWERVIALSPDDASAYIHVARLAAGSGDRAAFDTIAQRVERLRPSDEVSFELRALRAFAFGDSASRAAVARGPEFGAMKVAVGTELAGHVMGSSSDLAGVPAVWEAMTRAGVQGPDALGHLWLFRAAALGGRGDFARASVSIDSAMVYSAAIALRWRAFLATLPFAEPNQAELARVRAAIERGDTIAYQRGAAAWREFFRGLIALRSGDTAAAARLATSVERRAVQEKNVAVQLGPILRADILLREGRLADALGALGPLPNVVMWIGDPSSGLASAHDRWLRGELLARLGRDREALRVFASFPDVTGSDVVYAPAAHLRRGEILEHAGDATGAARHYRRALGYWATPRNELAALVARSKAGLARVTDRR
jgi:tetratricopeptide (TPR) repeat protein